MQGGLLMRDSGLQRREFLALGSAGFLSLCFGGAAEAQSILAAEAATQLMPVGYLEGSGEALRLRKLPLRIRQPRAAAQAGDATEYRIVPAASLPMGDTRLIGQPLRLTVHGLYPPGGLLPKYRGELPLAIDLDVLFPSPDPAFPEPIRYFAWSFRRQLGWNPSPPVSFVFPLDWNALPELAMRVVPADGGPARTFRTRFTFDQESGRPRLLRGTYALGTSPSAWRSAVALQDLGPGTPASLVSVLVSMESEAEAP
jgi:hypothetical protein